MAKKTLILIIIFYILILFQTSFLAHFNISGTVPNLVLIAVILISFFEKTEQKLGLISAFIGGLFLDIFIGNFMGINFFGLYFLISLGLAIFIKFVLRQYVRIPIIQRP